MIAHMEQNLCRNITHVQLVHSCAVFSQLKGIVDDSYEDFNDSFGKKTMSPPVVDLSDPDQFPVLGSDVASALPPIRPTQSINKLLLEGKESIDTCAKYSIPQTLKTPEDAYSSATFNTMGSRNEDTLTNGSLALFNDIPDEKLERMRRLHTIMLGERSRLEAKFDAHGKMYPREILDPISDKFNAELCRNKQGLFKCPFFECP